MIDFVFYIQILWEMGIDTCEVNKRDIGYCPSPTTLYIHRFYLVNHNKWCPLHDKLKNDREGC